MYDYKKIAAEINNDFVEDNNELRVKLVSQHKEIDELLDKKIELEYENNRLSIRNLTLETENKELKKENEKIKEENNYYKEKFKDTEYELVEVEDKDVFNFKVTQKVSENELKEKLIDRLGKEEDKNNNYKEITKAIIDKFNISKDDVEKIIDNVQGKSKERER